MITEEEIMRALKSRIPEEKFVVFHVNVFRNYLDSCGIMQIKDAWFSFYTFDLGSTNIIGPYFDETIIYEAAKLMGCGRLFKEYAYSGDDVRSGKYRRFDGFAEAEKYVDNLNKSKIESLSRLAGTLSNLSSEKRIK